RRGLRRRACDRSRTRRCPSQSPSRRTPWRDRLWGACRSSVHEWDQNLNAWFQRRTHQVAIGALPLDGVTRAQQGNREDFCGRAFFHQMKKPTKKLALNTETIRVMTSDNLQYAAGG